MTETPYQRFKRKNPERAAELNRKAQAAWRERQKVAGKIAKLGEITTEDTGRQALADLADIAEADQT